MHLSNPHSLLHALPSCLLTLIFVTVFSDEKDLLRTSLYISFQVSASSCLYGTLIVLGTRFAITLLVFVTLTINCNTSRPVQQRQESLLSFINFFTRENVGVIAPSMLKWILSNGRLMELKLTSLTANRKHPER
jgi:hypothetical protein